MRSAAIYRGVGTTSVLALAVVLMFTCQSGFAAQPAAQPVAKAAAPAADTMGSIVVPLNRSSLIVLKTPMSEVMIANPDIADVHAHNANNLTVIGKKIGRTNVRILDAKGNLLREFEVVVSYDLPAIRRSLKNFLPNEVIGVEMVNTSVALTGQVSNANIADKATKIVHDFIQSSDATGAATAQHNGTEPDIINMMQVISGQQVMLRVRVGEIDRTALKNLSVDLNGFSGSSAAGAFFGTGGPGLAGLLTPVGNTAANAFGPGHFIFPTDSNGAPSNTQGIVTSYWRPHGPNGFTLAGALQALEQDGLFKLLAEPNLVAISGEQAEFLAGGEIPIPVPQGGGSIGSSTTITIEYKPYGVAVRFKPFVLAENRVRMEVQPEVSELDEANAINVSGFTVPALTTRRANTTVELAPGEGFMIAGLLKDRSQATIDQLPGLKELPILGALFRSTSFQRNETELVIAVTPYIVDPMKSSDVKLPTDNMRQPSQMEMFFYGALGSLSGNARTISQTPPVEGPIGFMVD